jgi:hypothetical protein
MNMRGSLLTLRCRNCGERVSFSRADLQFKLRDLGFLRRDADPSDELLLEISQSLVASGRLGSCPACGLAKLGEATEAEIEAEEEGEWFGDVRSCKQCGSPIPPERIEVFPDTKFCAACQKKLDSGGAGKDDEYCPYCGDAMQLRAMSSPGAAYRMYCPSCRKFF